LTETLILIVDPDEFSRLQLARTIEKAGFSVIKTGRADEAVRYLDKYNPDLAILDEKVKGLTPERVLAEVQRRALDTFLILISANPDLARAMDWITGGVFAYLAKPVDQNQLIQTISKGLENREAYYEVVAMAEDLKSANEALKTEKTTLKERTDQLHFLYDLASRLSTTLNCREIVEIASVAVSHIFDSRLTAFLTVFSPEEEGRLLLDRPVKPDPARTVIKDLIQEAEGVREDHPVVVDLPESIAPTFARRPKHRFTMALTAAGRNCGVMGVYFNKKPRMNADRWMLLDSVALQTAQALFNAHQHENALKMASHDPLTGLYNRRAFNEHLAREVERYLRYGADLSLILLDLDNFKSINDRFGHGVGDDVLKKVADIIDGSVRATDITARFGGEEFTVILPDTRLDKAMTLARRIQERLRKARMEIGAVRIRQTVSQGVTDTASGALKDTDDLIRLADQAMYLAKDDGRDTIRRAPDPATLDTRKDRAYAC
jgi:diguanylate cyclase (GGDEF)-like protein